jgi:hypothetical protein
MNLQHISRRLAVVAIGAILVGLFPAAAMATGMEHFAVTVTGPVVAGTAADVTVTAMDPGNGIDTTYTGLVTLSSGTDSGATFADPYPFTADDLGVHVFKASDGGVTFSTGGSFSVTATDGDGVTGTSDLIAVDHGPVTSLTLAPVDGTVVDDTVVAGTVVTFVATGYDAYNDSWNATLTSDFAMVGGTCSDADCHSTVAGPHTVTATDKTNKDVSGSTDLTVTSDVATHLVIAGAATAKAGTLESYTVTAEDKYGNKAADYSGSVTVSVSDDKADVSTTTPTMDRGVGHFDVTFHTAGAPTLGASDGVFPVADFSVGVSPDDYNQLVIDGPATAKAGTAASYTVTAEDQFGNTVVIPADGVTVSATDSKAGLSTTTPTMTGGVGHFDVTFQTADTQKVRATDGDIHALEYSVDVSPDDFNKLVIDGPATAKAGTAASYTVTAEDQFGNTIVDYGGSVTVSKSDVAADLSPTVPDMSGGVGHFGVTFKTSGAQTLGAYDDTHTAPTFDVAVNPGDLSMLVIAGPSSTTAGVLQHYTVTAEDQFGNTYIGYVGIVNVSTTDSPSDLSTTTLSMPGGVGSFDVTFTTVGGQHIYANDSVRPAADKLVTVAAATAADKLVIGGLATAIVNGQQDYTVTAELNSGMIVTGYTGNITLSNSGGAFTSTSDVPAAGVATFHVTFTTAGNQTLNASDGTLTAAGKSVAVAAHGPATKFSVTGLTGGPAPVSESITVKALDAYNNVVTDYAGTVKFSSSDGGASLPVNSTLVSGQRVFSLTLLTAGTQTVTATDSATSGITGVSSAVTVTRVASEYHGLAAPVRLLDTRNGNGLAKGAAARLKAGQTVSIPITGRGGVDGNAVAITVNATIVKPGSSSTLYLGPGAPTSPPTYTIAFKANDVTAYGVTVQLGAGGTVSATYQASSGYTDLVLDVTGYFAPDTTGSTYYPLAAPVRLLDSRSGNGLSGKFKANVPRTFKIAGRSSVPLNAKAVTGNLTVTDASANWAVYLGPTSAVGPSSTINFVKGQTRANTVTMPLSSTGTLTATFLANSGQTCSLVFDVTGYYLPGAAGAMYVPVTPAAVLDTRSGVGYPGKFAANTPHTFQVANRAGVALNAVAVAGVVGVWHQTSNWAVYVGPVAVSKPSTSNLNFVKGDTCSNGLTVALSGSGTLSATFMASGSNTTDVVVYVSGYFVAATP